MYKLETSQSSAFVKYAKSSISDPISSNVDTTNRKSLIKHEFTCMPFSIDALLANEYQEQLSHIHDHAEKLEDEKCILENVMTDQGRIIASTETHINTNQGPSTTFMPLMSNFQHTVMMSFGRTKRRNQRERRPRTTFSIDQTAKLEQEYEENEYVTRSRRLKLAELLDLTEGQIKIWFQNRRAKDKRIEKAHFDQRVRYMALNMVAASASFATASTSTKAYGLSQETDFQQEHSSDCESD